MKFDSILAMLKSIMPVLEPLGEQGMNQLFDLLDAEVAKLGGDMKEIGPVLTKALREVALIELRKLAK